MTWRWLDDLVVPGLATLLESLWLAVLVAAVSGWAPALVLALALISVGSGTAIAVGLRRRPQAAAAGPPPASYLPLLPIGAITVAGMVRAWPVPVAMVVPAMVLVALLASFPVWLGLRIGRDPLAPADVPGRAARAFGVSFMVVLVAQASGRAVPGAAIAMAAIMLDAVVMAACARLAAGAAGHEKRRTQRLWLLGVFAAGAVIVGAGALLGGAMPSGLVLVPLHLVSTGLGYLLDAVGWTLGNVGALFVRGLSALAAHLHAHALPELDTNPAVTATPTAKPTAPVRGPARVSGQIVLAVLATVLIVLIARIMSRRHRRRTVVVDEERESVWSTGELLHAGADRVRRAVRRVTRLRGAKPRHAPDALRWEYRRLEHRLDDLGHTRPSGTTARRFLEGLTGDDPATVSELSALYELARYSAHEVGWDEVERFHSAAARLVAAARASSAPPVPERS